MILYSCAPSPSQQRSQATLIRKNSTKKKNLIAKQNQSQDLTNESGENTLEEEEEEQEQESNLNAPLNSGDLNLNNSNIIEFNSPLSNKPLGCK